jgi:hypothetical protein
MKFFVIFRLFSSNKRSTDLYPKFFRTEIRNCQDIHLKLTPGSERLGGINFLCKVRNKKIKYFVDWFLLKCSPTSYY